MCYGRSYHSHWKHHAHKWHKANKFRGQRWGQYPPVDVREMDDQYELLVYAAGFSKTDFHVNIIDNTLVVKAKVEENDLVDDINWRRREFKNSFERRFELNEKIDKGAIAAKYENGILAVTLPKLPGAETSRYDVDIV